MRIPDGMRALRHRDFQLFWGGQLVSLIGSWMQTVGQSWLVLELTNSAWKLGLISAMQFAPMLLLSLPAGAVVDRLPKRRLIVATQVGLMLCAFALSALVWLKVVQYWHVAVLAMMLGTINCLDMPGRQSFLAEMVGKADLMNAIALNSSIFNAARVLGPAIGGLLVAHNMALAFLFNGLSFIPVIFALLQIRAQGLPKEGPRRSIVEDVRAGLGYARRSPQVLLLLGLVFGISTFVVNWGVLVPLLTKQVLHQEARGYGFLMASMGVGALAGAIFLAWRSGQEQPLTTVMGAALAVCLAAVFMFPVHDLNLAAALLFVIGFAQPQFFAGSNTLLQVAAPDELRGRVASLYNLVATGSTTLGAALIGAVAEGFGAPAGFLTGGLLGLLWMAGLLLWWRRARLQGV